MNIWELLAVAVGLNLAGFVVAYRLASDKLTDFSYGTSFLLLSAIGFAGSHHNIYSWLALSVVALWAVRLAGFLLVRIIKTKSDKRFDGVRENFWKFGRFWLFQGISVWIILLPALFLFSNRPVGFTWLGGVGLIIWGSGLVIEAAADSQKFAFNSNPKNKGQWIERGLWGYSRHPNYLGEILVWAGVYIFAFSALSGSQRVIALASPLYISALLIFVSGIPKLEKSADVKWGNNADYIKYKKRTGLLVPGLNKYN